MLSLVAGVDSSLLVQFVLGGFGISGLVGAFVALYKLRPDVDSGAVVQAQGTMKMMKELTGELRTELDRCHKESEMRAAKITEQENLIKSLRELIHGMTMMEED